MVAHLIVDGATLAVAALAELDGVRSAAFADLGPGERSRLESMTDTRADEHLLGRHLLRTLVRELCGLAADDPVAVLARCETCGGPHGRPVVVDRDVRASIAHAGSLVVAAVAPSSTATAIGVDVEPLPVGDERARDAVRAWTRYEAVMKAERTGVVANRGEAAPHELAALVAALPRRYRVTAVDVPGHAVALALARALP